MDACRVSDPRQNHAQSDLRSRHALAERQIPQNPIYRPDVCLEHLWKRKKSDIELAGACGRHRGEDGLLCLGGHRSTGVSEEECFLGHDSLGAKPSCAALACT